MNVRRRSTESGVSGWSSAVKENTAGKGSLNSVNKMKKQDNKPKAIRGAIGVRPNVEGYHVLEGSVLKG